MWYLTKWSNSILRVLFTSSSLEQSFAVLVGGGLKSIVKSDVVLFRIRRPLSVANISHQIMILMKSSSFSLQPSGYNPLDASNLVDQFRTSTFGWIPLKSVGLDQWQSIMLPISHLWLPLIPSTQLFGRCIKVGRCVFLFAFAGKTRAPTMPIALCSSSGTHLGRVLSDASPFKDRFWIILLLNFRFRYQSISSGPLSGFTEPVTHPSVHWLTEATKQATSRPPVAWSASKAGNAKATLPCLLW